MDANYAGLCENVNNFSKDGIFASDRVNILREAVQFCYVSAIMTVAYC
jgi:hypothetical protein